MAVLAVGLPPAILRQLSTIMLVSSFYSINHNDFFSAAMLLSHFTVVPIYCATASMVINLL